MKYCSKCGAEYFDEKDRCPECDVVLVSENEWKEILARREAENREIFVKVWTVENQFEADIIKDALEHEKITVMVRSFHDTSFDGIYMAGKGWGVIMVPEDQKDKAMEIIEALKKSGTDLE